MIKNHGELAARFVKSADIIFVNIFAIVKDPFLRERVTFDAPSIDIDANRCELWFRIKEGVSNEELPEILEHVTGPSLFRIRSVIAPFMYCLEYKAKHTCNNWNSIINEIDEQKSEP